MATKPILTFVDDVFMTTDDHEAKPIVVALGLVNHMNAQLEGGGKKSAMVLCGHHPTHWIMSGKVIGFQTSVDNGYYVVGWPKRKVSAEAAGQQAGLFASLYFGGGPGLKLSFADIAPGQS